MLRAVLVGGIGRLEALAQAQDGARPVGVVAQEDVVLAVGLAVGPRGLAEDPLGYARAARVGGQRRPPSGPCVKAWFITATAIGSTSAITSPS